MHGSKWTLFAIFLQVSLAILLLASLAVSKTEAKILDFKDVEDEPALKYTQAEIPGKRIERETTNFCYCDSTCKKCCKQEPNKCTCCG